MALAKGVLRVWQVPAAGLEGATLPALEEGSAAKTLEAPGTCERGVRRAEDGKQEPLSGTAAAAPARCKDWPCC